LKEITFIFGSITKASRAKRLLLASKIKASAVKSSDKSSGECTHGIKIAKEDMYRAVMILRNSGIEYTLENDIS
jgi:hypothetical protein